MRQLRNFEFLSIDFSFSDGKRFTDCGLLRCLLIFRPLWLTATLLAVVFELRRNHCEQTNDFLSSMREDHVMGSR
jgi:hypothetical protein